jgi:chromosome segregation ATPase
VEQAQEDDMTTDDRKWILLDGKKSSAQASLHAQSMLSTPLQATEAELLEIRMRALLEENQKLRDALRGGKRASDEGMGQGSADSQLLKQLQDLGAENRAQRDQVDQIAAEKDQMAAELSKAQNNLERKVEMIEILRVQLDEADLRASKNGGGEEERMKMQEALMASHAQLDKVTRELDAERVLKEKAWETLLKVDPEKTEALETKLEDERLNAKEMLAEIRSLRAEKDAAAVTMKALADERDSLKNEVNQARSGSESLQHERVDALEKLQSLREDYANLDVQVHQSKSDNEALMSQLKFLTQQLQARHSEQVQEQPVLNNNLQPTVFPSNDLHTADLDGQARFYEQQVGWYMAQTGAMWLERTFMLPPKYCLPCGSE